jgi:hypothetical protein
MEYLFYFKKFPWKKSHIQVYHWTLCIPICEIWKENRLAIENNI